MKEDGLKQVACELINKHTKHGRVVAGDLRFWAWPQVFPSTNPHGIGGQMMTSHTIYCFESINGDAALFVAGRGQYVPSFTPMMAFNTSLPSVPVKQQAFPADEVVEEMVPISRRELDTLQKRADWLDCLEAAGVDNWSGISYAYECQENDDEGGNDGTNTDGLR